MHWHNTSLDRLQSVLERHATCSKWERGSGLSSHRSGRQRGTGLVTGHRFKEKLDEAFHADRRCDFTYGCSVAGASGGGLRRRQLQPSVRGLSEPHVWKARDGTRNRSFAQLSAPAPAPNSSGRKTISILRQRLFSEIRLQDLCGTVRLCGAVHCSKLRTRPTPILKRLRRSGLNDHREGL